MLFRELYLGGVGQTHEAELVEAQKMGVTFFRYRQEHPPVIGDETVDIFDTLTGEPLRIPFDRVVLTMPFIPQELSNTLAALLSLPQDEAGFLAEPRIRLRPGRYADPGIYVLGSAQQPADTAEALFQAYLTSCPGSAFPQPGKHHASTRRSHPSTLRCAPAAATARRSARRMPFTWKNAMGC